MQTLDGKEQAYRIACLELRGGNEMADYAAELPGLSSWVSSRPLPPAARGGDLHYLSACSHGEVARVVLADVSGHGELVSAAASRLHDALRIHIERWDQSALIRQLNDSFLNNGERILFATAFLASFHADSGRLLFTNAGHVPPLRFSRSSCRWSFLLESAPPLAEAMGPLKDLPLGLIAGTAYNQTMLAMEPGDLLMLYTDGINEAGDEAGERLGLEGLLAMAETLPTHSAAAAGRALLAAVSKFRGTRPAGDDETVVALQMQARAA